MSRPKITVGGNDDRDLERLKADLAKKGWDANRLQKLGVHWDKGNGIPRAGIGSEAHGANGSPETDEGWSGVRYRIDPPNPKPAVHINCADRVHLCKAVCCKLNFILTPSEVQAGKVKWDDKHPYLIAHQPNGYCAHIEGNLRCNVYSDRPALCRRFDCSKDPRIWKDFDNYVVNREWIDRNTASEDNPVPRLSLPLMQPE